MKGDQSDLAACVRTASMAALMKVLVVEDDPFIREMAVAGSEEAGFEVMDAGSGEEALRLLQAGITLDAVLTDVRLPGANGWAVA
jgi:CheY-like chemotaxis protein